MVYSDVVHIVQTKAVALLLWGYMGNWLVTTTAGILSQNQSHYPNFFFFISMCKIQPSPSLMIVAAIDLSTVMLEIS